MKRAFWNVPAHLLSREEKKNRAKAVENKTVEAVNVEGYPLTKKQKQYCQELIFSGVDRKLQGWASYFGVTIDTIKAWNKMPGVILYKEELRKTRMDQIQDTVNNNLGSVLLNTISELDGLLKMKTTITLGSGDRAREVVSVGLVEQKRELIMGALKLLKTNDPDTVFNFNINNDAKQQNNIQQNIQNNMNKMEAVDGVPSIEEIDAKLKDITDVGETLESGRA